MPENPAEQAIKDLGPMQHKKLRWSRRGATRFKVFAVWMVVLLFWAITRSAPSWRIFEVTSLLVLGFFLWPFVQGPYLLYRNASRPLHADYRLWTGQIKPDFPEYRMHALLNMGFRYAGQLVEENKKNVMAAVSIFVHPGNLDSAQLGKIVTGLGTTEGLIFKSRFHDGFAFETSSFGVPPVFPPDPQFPIFRFPDVRLTRDLYRLHCKIKEQFLSTHNPAIGEPEGELAEFIARAEIVNQRHVNSPDYKLSPAGDRYIYTVRGAIRHAWLHASPVKSFRIMRIHARSMKMAEQLGLRINPKFGSVEPLARKS